ncbi:MAG: hypothetical protein LRS46_02590 [Desulfurococcales archaeon]|nr:hypothetical protein [Desulfurococcales archaeon]
MRAWIAIAGALAALMLTLTGSTLLASEAIAASSHPLVYVHFTKGGIVTVGNTFFNMTINASAGASTLEYSVLGLTLCHCNQSAYSGIHPAFHLENMKSSILTEGAWRAKVLVNTSEKVVLLLQPTHTLEEATKPLKINVKIVVTADEPFPLYIITLYNAGNSSIRLLSNFDENYGFTIAFSTCPSTSQSPLIASLYGNLTDYEIRVIPLKGLERSPLVMVNSTHISTILACKGKGSEVFQFINNPKIKYYAAIVKNNTVTLYAIWDIKTLAPHQYLKIVVAAGLLPYNPLLLEKAGLGKTVYALNKLNYINTTLEQSKYKEKINELVFKLNYINTTLEQYKTLYNNCKENLSKDLSKIGELEELYNTCKVNNGIIKNDLERTVRELHREAAKTVAFTTAGVIVGVLGGYLLSHVKRGVFPRR